MDEQSGLALRRVRRRQFFQFRAKLLEQAGSGSLLADDEADPARPIRLFRERA